MKWQRREMVVGHYGMVIDRRGLNTTLYQQVMASGFMAGQCRPEPIAIFLQMSNRQEPGSCD